MSGPAAAAPIRRIAIVGGGTAGWMAAAGLAAFATSIGAKIELVEAEEIATVGVGEATIPPIMDYLRALRLDEDDLLRATGGSIKLGIEFRDWTRPGHAYFHPFGATGYPLRGASFSACWQRLVAEGEGAPLEAYSLQAAAAAQGRFMRAPRHPRPPLEQITYALHFDAVRFARHLRSAAERGGVKRTEGRIVDVALDGETGFVRRLTLADGRSVEADLFIDCSGFVGLVIQGALKAGFEDWSRWLPCNRAVALASERSGPAPPFTRATAREAGWTWRIPLQHRVGNGYVYCDALTSDARAVEVIQGAIEGEPLAEPRQLSFRTGHRSRFWVKNCVALGLAAGFLEPLESTSIHLIQRGVSLLLQMFPSQSFNVADIDKYNQTLAAEFRNIRDFLLLHYSQTERTEELWRAMRALELPDSLKARIELFQSYGRIYREEGELFPVQSWLYVLWGQGLRPREVDPISLIVEPQMLRRDLASLRQAVEASVAAMPGHQAFLDAL